jgi:hypothetical protein
VHSQVSQPSPYNTKKDFDWISAAGESKRPPPRGLRTPINSIPLSLRRLRMGQPAQVPRHCELLSVALSDSLVQRMLRTVIHCPRGGATHTLYCLALADIIGGDEVGSYSAIARHARV